jgi:hypothetical protein
MREAIPRELSEFHFSEPGGRHTCKQQLMMQTYGLMVNLTPGQEAEAREKVSNFLKDKGGDEHN